MFGGLKGDALRCYSLCAMSTLAEIESAVEALPPREQRKLYEFLARRLEPSPSPPTAHDLMRDGCGIVSSGIGDLATDPKHLEGLGRR